METEIDTELLISMVQERSPLWDKSREHYKSRRCTTECWRVCIHLNANSENLEVDKDNYGKCTNIFLLLYLHRFNFQ